MTSVVDEESISMRGFLPGKVALRDAWFPLVHAKKTRRPTRRALHGQPVWIWRDRGVVRATAGSPAEIERGQRRESEFTDPSGAYPVVERYGYAWIWYGDPVSASPDLIPNVPHIPVQGMPTWFQGNVLFDCSYELVCENLLDLTHADFLHSSLTGDPLGEDDRITVESTSETVTMTRTAHDRPVPRLQRSIVKGADRQDVRLVTLVHVRSGVCILHGEFKPGMSMRMLHPVNPETRTRCRTPVTYNPQLMPKLGRALFPLTAHPVGRQDNWALRPQNRFYLRPDVQKDMSSRFDRADLRYRKVYQDLVARQARGDYTYLADGDPARDVTEELGLS